MPHRILQHFRYEHLRPDLQAASKPFCEAAQFVARNLPENDESREALRKLLEAKDCAVRALIEGPEPEPVPKD